MFTAEILGNGGGGVVKLWACGATDPGFESRSRHFNFQRWVYFSDLNVDRNPLLMIYNLHVKFSGH